LKLQHGRRRVVIEDVNPQLDGGRHAIHRIAGDEVFVTAAIYADGKDELAERLLYRHSSDAQWRFVPMAQETTLGVEGFASKSLAPGTYLARKLYAVTMYGLRLCGV